MSSGRHSLDDHEVVPDGRRRAGSPERNRDAILAVLRDVLPGGALVLEVASGTGQHAAHFAPRLPVTWQPTEWEPALLKSIEAWRAATAAPNLRAPLRLDVDAADWPVEPVDAVVCINMLHIVPASRGDALLRGAARGLACGGVLYLYGPYFRRGGEPAPSNVAFDQRLRAKDPAFGVRVAEAIVERAARLGFDLAELRDMPNHNTSIVLRRS
ncbi:MAG: DUF938 domain-containing protein [Planctomycetota bacterium]